jgi:hypothetical protein
MNLPPFFRNNVFVSPAYFSQAVKNGAQGFE